MTRRKILLICFFMISFFTLFNNVYADYKASFVADGKCALTKGATGNCVYKDTTFKTAGPIWLDTGDQITVYTNKAEVAAPKTGNGSECKSTFVYISNIYKNKTYYGYVCKSNVRRNDGAVSSTLQTKFKNAGFPESYWSKLAVLQEAHSNWTFKAINTGLDFKTAVTNEDNGNRSLIQVTDTKNKSGFLSTKETNYNWLTDSFKVYDGSSWYAANYDTIAYYMDPRNFLSETYIFQFELLSYDKNIHNLAGVQEILGNSYIKKFASYFMEAAEQQKVNPIYLASLSRQELGGGTTAGRAVSGAAFTYNGVKYSNKLYNFYNIGATSGSDGLSAIRGLIYANGGENKSGGYGSATTHNRPWNTEKKAIIGGASWINNGYISVGQDTSYFKKWDIQSINRNGTKKTSLYTHQYMQNIMAPSSEAYTTFQSYNNMKYLSRAFTFYIPVYSNMPASTNLPAQGSPNNYLKTLTYNIGSGNKTVTGFSGSTTSYTFHVANNIPTITLAGTTVNSNAKVSGLGTKNLVVGTNKISIVVTAGNGTKRTYTVNVIRDAATGALKSVSQIVKDGKLNIDGSYITGLSLTTSVSSIKNTINAAESRSSVTIKRGSTSLNSGNVVTGDVVTITSGSESKTYTVVLYGDTNGDGKINALDLLRVQKQILGTSKLTGAKFKAADPSKDGKINALDLLKVQKHILGSSIISQK